MTKRLLISLLTLTMGLHLTGCTSDNAAQDSEESVVSSDDSFNQENSGDFEEGASEDGSAQASAEGGESVDDTALEGDAPAEGAQAAAPTEGEAAPADATTPAEGGETDELALDDGGDPANEFPDEVAGADGAAPADQAATGEAAPADPAATPEGTETAATGEQPTDAAVFDPAAGGEPSSDQASSEPPAVDDSANADTSVADTSTDTGTTDVVASEEPAPKPYLPLLKIKDAPFENGGTLLNRYYVAREGDTTKSVSEKIYGSNRSKDLKKWNVLLANRPMKVGDKVYYNSPKDPADSSKMISWYEENGVAPSTYTAQEGDDIRELSEKLLGNKNSWKELWATNMDVESKGALPAGTELRYFPADASQQAVASNATPPVAETAPAAPADQAMNQPMDQGLPPDDPTLNQQPDIAMNPPGQDMNANAGTVAPPQDMGAPPPPPPPDMAQAAPPPPPMEPMQAPPPPKPTTRAAAADEEMAGDPDQTMMLGAAGLLLLGGVLAFSVIRRKRASKRIDMTQTQI